MEPGDAAWRAWLDETSQNTFRYGGFSGRRELKAERSYWYAYRKSGGKLRKAYLGRSEDLTRDRLELLAAQLAPGTVRDTAATPATVRLPRPPTPLIGRDAIVAAVGARVLAPETRLLTLFGPGGTGKTRLAIAVAEYVSQRFDGTIDFVDLSAIVDADLVLREIAHHLDVLDVGEVPVRVRLQQHLATRPTLLVLDNLEQVVAAAPDLASLIEECPRLRLLVTSREALHLRVESVFPVPPLALPDLTTRLVADTVQHVPAVDLFLRRARAAGATIELQSEVLREVAELCVRLDGLPLAIELAAARARLLTPREMLARLGRQVDLLRTYEADRTPRHQSLRAVVGWSYDLLSNAERLAFQRLAVFAGGCSLDAAEAVLDELAALDLIASLIDKSLVRNEPGPGGETRLRMLETIRAFGLEQLANSGDEPVVRARHAAYFLSLVQPQSWAALDLPTPDWLAMVEIEHDNVRAALRWSSESGDRRTCLDLAAVLQGFWVLGGYLREGLQWLEHALTLAEGLDPLVEALCHQAAGQIAWRQGDYDGAARHYSAGLALRRALGDPLGVAIALQGLASVARDRGDVHEAILLWEECVAVFRASGNRVRIARATLNLAIALHLAGQSERAATLLEEAATLAGQIGQHWANATASTYLGLIALEVWHAPARAATHTRHALTLAPRVGDMWVTAHLLELAAWLASGESAIELLAAADALRERSGARLHPAFKDGHDRVTAANQASSEFNGAWQRGSSAQPEDMLRLALQVVREMERAPSSAQTVATTDTHVLSGREREIAALVAQGLTSRQIADRLIVGERTVETHVDHIRAKLGVRSRAQIAAWAVERGLVSQAPTPSG